MKSLGEHRPGPQPGPKGHDAAAERPVKAGRSGEGARSALEQLILLEAARRKQRAAEDAEESTARKP